MYDRRLDGIIAAAELGTFSRAAAKLRISTPALVKQVSGFEAEHGIVLFERSHTGVTLTAAGALLVDDARSIIRQSGDAFRRARGIDSEDGAVRLGISLMCPGRNTLELWPRVHELEPGLRLEIVPVGDLYSDRDPIMMHLGQNVDVVQSSYSTVRWGGSCGLLPLFSSPFHIDVPRASPLASRTQLLLDDLVGMRIRILRHGNDATDGLRELLLARGQAEVIDVESFDFALFNDAEEKGDVVLTSGAWAGIHPGFVGVPLACGREVPCFLAYPRDPEPQVERFVEAMRRALATLPV